MSYVLSLLGKDELWLMKDLIVALPLRVWLASSGMSNCTVPGTRRGLLLRCVSMRELPQIQNIEFMMRNPGLTYIMQNRGT